MNDPHVVSLSYKLETPESVSFNDAPPLSYVTPEFDMELADGLLVAKPKVHFASVSEARDVLDPFVRSWELDSALTQGRSEIWFRYSDAKVIDRDPPPPGTSQVIRAESAGFASVVGDLTVKVNQVRYPDPPDSFKASPDVEWLWNRFEGYREGREPLLSMAYFCLSFVESITGGRDIAAAELGFSRDVLSKLGELTSTRGDEETARKFDRSSPQKPLAGAEVSWIEETIRRMIRRLGEIEADVQITEITMKDLPAI